jgi:hypothetical protein
MKFTIDEFRAWKNKSVTLLGMSGVGKTHLSMLLRSHNWFHYSATIASARVTWTSQSWI